jgi:acetyl esterase/lipase
LEFSPNFLDKFLPLLTKFLTLKLKHPIVVISINCKVFMICPQTINSNHNTLIDRLSPENPFPAGLIDTQDSLAWIREHSAELNIARDKIVVGGESAGANLAAAVSLFDSFTPPIAYQVLTVPLLDVSDGWRESSSYLEWKDGDFNDDLCVDVVRRYCVPPHCDTSDPLVSPLRANNEQLAQVLFSCLVVCVAHLTF